MSLNLLPTLPASENIYFLGLMTSQDFLRDALGDIKKPTNIEELAEKIASDPRFVGLCGDNNLEQATAIAQKLYYSKLDQFTTIGDRTTKELLLEVLLVLQSLGLTATYKDCSNGHFRLAVGYDTPRERISFDFRIAPWVIHSWLEKLMNLYGQLEAKQPADLLQYLEKLPLV